MKDHHKMRAWVDWPDGIKSCFLYQESQFDYWTSPDSDEWEISDWDNQESLCIFESCTGLKDKNGKLIYEGDGVPLAGYGLYIAEFPFAELFDAHHENDVGVICGNIHENPKLLESE